MIICSVQEPFHEWTPTRFGSQTLFGIVAGQRFGNVQPPEHLRNRNCRRYYRDGSRLPRVFSRAILEIVSVREMPPGLVCRAIMANIDEFFSAKALAREVAT